MNNTNNLAKQLISAVAHTANYLKLAADRLRSLEGNASGIEDQLSDIQELLSELRGVAKGFTYGTPEYWQHQRVEIFKVALATTIQDKYPHEALLLAAELAEDSVEMFQAKNDSEEVLEQWRNKPQPSTEIPDLIDPLPRLKPMGFGAQTGTAS